jgi:arsenite-transporting ATPase
MHKPFNHLMAAALPFLDAPSYKWIFVGGKGGVGKTTTACSIAVALTRSRDRVLLVSTDPASNIGDTFQQHFAARPIAVNGFPKLWAMEAPSKPTGESEGFMDLMMNVPGIDELQALSSLFDSIERDEFDVVVFDTAPTGHTMRLLGLPKVAEGLLGGFGSLLGDMAVTAASQLLGGSDGENATSRIQNLQTLLRNAGQRLINPMECTFVCVLLPEFLPLYETERLIDFLTEKSIETHCLVVNQVMPEQKEDGCKFCCKRYTMQQKYLSDIHELYSDEFRVVEVPIQDDEVKGEKAVRRFTELISRLFSPG